MNSKKSDTAEPLKTFARFLQARRLRMTHDRRVIVEKIFNVHGHFSMDDLFVALRLKGEPISKTTLYRNLPLLVESGLIRRVPGETVDGKFEHVLGHPHHDHLICLLCGREIEFSCNEIESAQDNICRRYGFHPLRHRLGIWGYCRHCRPRGAGWQPAKGSKNSGGLPTCPTKSR